MDSENKKWFFTEYETLVNLNEFCLFGLESSGDNFFAVVGRTKFDLKTELIFGLFSKEEEARDYIKKIYNFLIST